jgi:hypothetical protein
VREQRREADDDDNGARSKKYQGSRRSTGTGTGWYWHGRFKRLPADGQTEIDYSISNVEWLVLQDSNFEFCSSPRDIIIRHKNGNGRRDECMKTTAFREQQ